MKIDARAIRAAQKALLENGDDDRYANWPKNRFGYPKLAVIHATADRLIASGEAVEDDFLRMDDLPGGA